MYALKVDGICMSTLDPVSETARVFLPRPTSHVSTRSARPFSASRDPVGAEVPKYPRVLDPYSTPTAALAVYIQVHSMRIVFQVYGSRLGRHQELLVSVSGTTLLSVRPRGKQAIHLGLLALSGLLLVVQPCHNTFNYICTS